MLPEQTVELQDVHLLFPAALAERVVAGAEEVVHADAGYLDGVLEREEESAAGPLLRGEGQQVLAVERDRPRRDDVAGMARQHISERTLPGAVGAHDGVRLAGGDMEVDAREDLDAAYLGAQVSNVEHQPTAPSRFMSSRRFASTANSSGSRLTTSRTNPLMINDWASSGESPRC